MDISIKAVFWGPSNQTIEREAYWDGGNIYRISFAPIEVGMWSYNLKADQETGLDGVTGTIECIPYSGDLEIYKHGFIKVSEDGRYFTYADDTPFFWLGDTHWEFCYKEKWEESNHPQMQSMFKGMIDKRFEQGYTVYQTNLRSDAVMGGEPYYWKEDLPNIDFYQKELDRRMYYLAGKGIVNALGLAWFMSIENNIDRYKQLARYIIARYGALPVVWTLAGETGGYIKGEPQKRYVDSWREVALYIEQNDGYHHLQTAHYTNERPFAEYYQEEDWMDFTLNQAGHGDFVISVNDYRDFLKKHGDKPFVEGEAMYEFCSTLEENGTRLCTDAMVRRVAYLTIQTGGCGYTYGAQGIWDTHWEKGDSNTMNVFNRFDIPWYQAIDGIAGAQMGYMKDFYMKEKFWELYPYDAGDESVGNPFGKKLPCVTVSKDAKHWILYYPASTRKSGMLKGFRNAVYETTWFNPRSGQYKKGESFTVENNEWRIPQKPDPEDWLLIVKER